jgi:hypothetical protein
MNVNIKRGIATGALALSLLGGSAASVAAHHTEQHQSQLGGAAGLVAAVVQVAAQLDDTTVEVVSVDINDSLNNLTALNNILNNSPILSNNDIDVVDVIDIGEINVLSGDQQQILTNFLNDSNILVSDVIAVAVLSGGDLIVLT